MPRQLMSSANEPPMIGPRLMPSAIIAPQKPITNERCDSGVAALRTASEVPNSEAAPMPWPSRPARSTKASPDNATTSAPSANTTMPNR